jgi:hypothetical protein
MNATPERATGPQRDELVWQESLDRLQTMLTGGSVGP